MEEGTNRYATEYGTGDRLEMKTIIAGGRTITDYSLVLSAIGESNFTITEIVSGMAPGVDTLAVQYAEENNLPLAEFHADWNQYKKAAGPIRNREMANYADALIAIWDGESRGTKNMIEEATKRGLQVYVKRTDQ
jgi:predicted Rossmann fold nucleotide-binding protein DprA/Smf involved in DNA uptake